MSKNNYKLLLNYIILLFVYINRLQRKSCPSRYKILDALSAYISEKYEITEIEDEVITRTIMNIMDIFEQELE